jgi:hypothetical protein
MVSKSGMQNRALVIALLASLLLWNLPFGGIVLYPFKVFATWWHELSHGLVMLVTGAGFDRMEVYQDTSGFAYSMRHPGALGMSLVASAGYMGTSVGGAVLLVVGQTRRGARIALAVIGGALLLSAALWVRNQFGVVSVLVGGAVFVGFAVLASDRVAKFLLNFVAAQACINAVLDIRVLFRSNLVVNGEVMSRSDAHNMADATFGNAWMWAAVWLVWSFGLFYWALRRSHLTEGSATSARSSQGSASI